MGFLQGVFARGRGEVRTARVSSPSLRLPAADGEVMVDYCRRRGLPLNDALRLFDDVCGLMQASHDCGVYFQGIGIADVRVYDSDDSRVVDIIAARKSISDVRGVLPPGVTSAPALSRAELSRAVDVWQLGQVLVLLAANYQPIPELLREILARANAVDTHRFATVSQLRAAIAGFVRGKRSAVLDSRHGLKSEIEVAEERGLTPLPV